MIKKIELTEEQVLEIRGTYEANKEDLNKVADYIAENGSDDSGCQDAEATFEQGYNNALEYIMNLLGIEEE